MLSLLYLTLGFILLFYGGKFLVQGGVNIAEHFKISKLVVGVTVVSLGTSAPELVVSVGAALSGHPDISLGNVIGSNISNIALVLAFSAIIFPIAVNRNSTIIDWPIMMAAGLGFLAFMWDGVVERWEGIIFISALLTYILVLIRSSRKNPDESNNQEPRMKLGWAFLMVVGASIALVYGANFMVDGASEIARGFGVSERVISVSIIAFGTSVPELSTSIIAAAKKETDISIGNIIGSNSFNILGIIGVTSVVKSIAVDSKYFVDMAWMLGIAALLFVFMLPIKGGVLKRWKGAILLLSYVAYILYVFSKNGM
jgi:cation:H+ antiporter